MKGRGREGRDGGKGEGGKEEVEGCREGRKAGREEKGTEGREGERKRREEGEGKKVERDGRKG